MEDMTRYSIKDLENFTSIKAHTIRIWEQRYNLFEPHRTSTNIRYYTEADLKKILNINLLYNHGHKISKIAKMSDQEILKIAEEIVSSEGGLYSDVIDNFIRLIAELDDNEIRNEFVRLTDELGLEESFVNVYIPLLEKIGELWQLNTLSVSQEHFFSNLLREFFINSISEIPVPIPSKGKVVLFLHEQERHELSLLFYYYYLKSSGYECYYLGQQVPLDDLKAFVVQMKPDFLYTSLISAITERNIKELFSKVGDFFPLDKLKAGGIQLSNHKKVIPSEIQQIQSLDDILKQNV